MSAARRPRGADLDQSSEAPAKRRADGLTFSRAAATRHLRTVDPRLGMLIDAAGPFDVRPEHDVDPFPYLLRSILFQQLHGAAARAIHARLLARWDDRVPTPQELLATSMEELRAIGVSGNKALAMHSLAAHALDGVLPTAAELDRLPDSEIVERFTAVRGVGPWTVHMLLLFRLGRPDVLPTGDFGVREGWRLLTGAAKQSTPTAFRADAEPWRPYRSVAAWYLWRAVDLHREGRLPT